MTQPVRTGSIRTGPIRTSPIHDRLQSLASSLNGSWQMINGMSALTGLPHDEPYVNHLGLADLSFLTRFGVKGPKAAAWLTQQGLLLPDRPNSWCALPEGGIVARLGANEFLIEDSLHSQIAAQLTQACQQPPAQVYPVLRQDAALALCGMAVNDLLRQTCNINFAALTIADRPVILTSLIGVSAIVIPGEIRVEQANYPLYRIWCDGTFGAYVWHTLLTIVEELGGGAIGAAQVIRQ